MKLLLKYLHKGGHSHKCVQQRLVFFYNHKTAYGHYSLIFLLCNLSFFIILFPAFADGSGNLRKVPSANQIFATDSAKSFDSVFQQSLSVLYNNPDSARLLIQQAFTLDLFENQNQKARSLNLLGVTHHLQANYIIALDYYYEALSLAVELNDNKRIADIYNNVGSVNLKIGNYNAALEDFFKAKKYYNDLGLVESEASVLNNIGLIYIDLKNFEKARLHFRQAYQGFESKDDSIGMAASFSNIGILYSENGLADSAFFYINQAIDINTRIENKYNLCISLQAKANTCLDNEMYEQAIDNYLKSNTVAQSINHEYQIGYTYYGLARAYLKTGEMNAAHQNAGLALQIADRINNKKLKQETHNILTQIYEQQGDFQKSLESFRHSVDLKEELINQTKLHQIYNIEIDNLNQAKAIQQLRIQQQELLISKKNNIIVFIIIAFMLVIGGVYLIYLNHNHRREASHQKDILILTEKKSRAAIEAEIQERNRIGRELHDGLGQMLSAIRLNISALQQKSSLNEQRRKELIDFAIESVDKAFYELRDISHNLAPSVLAEKGLTGALMDLANQVNQSKHLQMKFEAYGMNGSIDTLAENTLYRAAQELLTNSIKHANATTFSVQLVKSNTEVTLMVEDNGKGFTVDQTLILPGGGLNNIKSRVENLNGQVFIDAMENRGSIVTIVIPIKHPEHARKED
jgi:two-component system, NarL family, sensor kinase